MSRASTSVGPSLGLLGVLAAVPIAVYAIRPDLLPGGFHGIDLLLVVAGAAIAERLRRDRGNRPEGARGDRTQVVEHVAAVLLLCTGALIAVTILERGPNRIHDLQGVAAAASGLLGWLLQWGFEASGSYATVVQSFWIAGAIAQLCLVSAVVAAVSRSAQSPRGAALRAAVAVLVLSFTYAATPGVYLPFNGYFAVTSRAWEFAAGCIAALAVARTPLPGVAARSLTLLGGAGFLASCVLVPAASSTNTSWSAVPSVVCALVMLVGALGTRTTTAPSRWAYLEGGARVLVLPLALAPGLVVGMLAYVFPPVWIPGSNPVRDWTAVAGTLAVAVGTSVATRSGLRRLSQPQPAGPQIDDPPRLPQPE